MAFSHPDTTVTMSRDEQFQPIHWEKRNPLADALWFPINLLQAISLALVCLLMIPPALLVRRLTGRPEASLWMARHLWAPVILAGGLSRLRVKGLENLDPTRPTLVICNHSSYADIPILYRSLPVPLHFIGKSELARIPLIGAFGKAVGTVFVERSTRRRAAEGITELTAALRRGEWTVSFPEGTRSRNGRLGAFATGTLSAAIASCADIIPVAIHGSGRMLAPGGFSVRPSHIFVRIGCPIPTSGLTMADRPDLLTCVKTSLHCLLEDLSNE